MSDPKIRIPIELPAGDQAGATEAAQALEDLKQSADDLKNSTGDLADEVDRETASWTAEQEAQAEADAQRARSRQSEAAQAESLAEIQGQLTRIIQTQIGAWLNDMANGLRGVSAEQDLLANSLAAFAAGLQTGNPYVAIAGAAGAAGASIKTAFDQAKEVERQAAEQIRETEQALQRWFAAREATRKQSGFDAALQREGELLEAQARSLENIIKLEATRRGTTTAVREAQQRIDQAKGVDTSAADRAGDVADRLAGIEASVEDARRRAAQAEEEAAQARLNVSQAVASEATTGEQVDAAKKAAEEAEKAAVIAVENLEVVKQQAELQKAAALAEAEARVAEATQETGEAITQNALDALQDVKDSTNAAVQGLAAQIAALVQDSIPDAEQAEPLRQLLEQLRLAASRERAELFSALSENVELSRQAVAVVAAQRAELTELRKRLDSVKIGGF